MRKYFGFNKEFMKFLPIFLIMISVMLLMGTSYALLRSSQQGENTYVMQVGLLEVTFVDSKTNALTIENMVPATDSDGMKQTNELVFTVKNTGDYKASYDVYIEETSTTPEFKTMIRFISNKNDAGYNDPKTLSEDYYIDQGGILEVGEEATYKVKTWLNENADSTYMNKTFTARIVVVSNQVVSSSPYMQYKELMDDNPSCSTSSDGSYNVDVNREGSFAVKLVDEEEIAAPGISVGIYKIAGFNDDGCFGLTNEFLDYMNYSDWQNLDVTSLVDYIDTKGLSYVSIGNTNVLGELDFGNLNLGLYLIVQVDGFDRYQPMEPSLVLIPSITDPTTYGVETTFTLVKN